MRRRLRWRRTSAGHYEARTAGVRTDIERRDGGWYWWVNRRRKGGRTMGGADWDADGGIEDTLAAAKRRARKAVGWRWGR